MPGFAIVQPSATSAGVRSHSARSWLGKNAIHALAPVLSRLAPEYPWEAVASSGIALLNQSRTGPAELPPEWSSLAGGRPQPASGFDRVFGYNAIRIPLYLMRSELATPGLWPEY